jgi:uncharacterized protein YneF (UPF0154 family)
MIASLAEIALVAPLAFGVGVFVGLWLGNRYVLIRKRNGNKHEGS